MPRIKKVWKDFENLDDIMCALPHDLFAFTNRAIVVWYEFGDRHLLKEASERTGLSEEDILFWWDC